MTGTRVYATDINDAKTELRSGAFPPDKMQALHAELQAAEARSFSEYYAGDGDSAQFFQISLVENVVFAQHNLANLTVGFNEFNLDPCAAT